MIVVIVVGIITGLIIAAIAFLNSEHGNPTMLFERVGPLLDRARAQLPAGLVEYLPASPDDIRATVLEWLREHASQLQGAGKKAIRIIVQIIIGIVIGAMIALHKARNLPPRGPLVIALTTRAGNLVT